MTTEINAVDLLHHLEFASNLVEKFDSNNDRLVFQLRCLKKMIETVKPINGFFPVMSVYQKLASHFDVTMFVIRSSFVKLQKAGLVNREQVAFQIGDDEFIQQDVFILDFANINHLNGI